MNYKRALGFAILLYVVLFILMVGIQQIAGSFVLGLREYIALWIISIPIVLFFAKWYFKMDTPSTAKGFKLGIIALIIGAVLDAGLIYISAPTMDMTFSELYGIFYTDWKFYIAVAEILALTTFAGFEFDATYTKKAGQVS